MVDGFDGGSPTERRCEISPRFFRCFFLTNESKKSCLNISYTNVKRLTQRENCAVCFGFSVYGAGGGVPFNRFLFARTDNTETNEQLDLPRD